MSIHIYNCNFGMNLLLFNAEYQRVVGAGFHTLPMNYSDSKGESVKGKPQRLSTD